MEKIKVSDLAKKFGYKANVFVEKCQDQGWSEIRTMTQHIPENLVEPITNHFQDIVDRKEQNIIKQKQNLKFKMIGVAQDDSGQFYVAVADVPQYIIETNLIKRYGSEKFKSRLNDEWLQANYDHQLIIN